VCSTPEHLVQLFDAPRSLADAASRFLAEGWKRDEDLLVIARPRHWQLMAEYLEQRGCPVRHGMVGDRLQMIDATETCRRIHRRGVFDQARATGLLTTIMRTAQRPGRRLCVYVGLMELLAEEGAFDAAAHVEDIWNDMQGKFGFRLLCGYLAAHFTDAQTTSALRTICGKHSAVQTHSADTLGTWLTTFPLA
jgi:hypothetical protein